MATRRKASRSALVDLLATLEFLRRNGIEPVSLQWVPAAPIALNVWVSDVDALDVIAREYRQRIETTATDREAHCRIQIGDRNSTVFQWFGERVAGPHAAQQLAFDE